MSDEDGSLSPRIERNSSLWKRVSWNRSSSPNAYSDSDERTRLLRNNEYRSDDAEVSIEINQRYNDVGGGDVGGDGRDEIDKDAIRKTAIERNLEETQAAVHSSIGVLLRRGEDINNLRNRADELQGTGSMFKKTAKKVYNDAWLDHLQKKSTVIAFYVTFFLLLLLMVLGIIQMMATAYHQIRNPPAASPPPGSPPPAPTVGAPGGGPGTGTGTGGGNGIQVTCNCFCPPNPPKTFFADSDELDTPATPQIQVS